MGGFGGHLSAHPRGAWRARDRKADLKKLMPEDAKEATGHGIKAKRSKSEAISFEAQVEASHAPIH